VFRVQERVPAGAMVVGRGEPRLVALQGWSESLLAQLLQPGERTGQRHAFLEKIVRGYLVGIMVLAVLAGIGWWVGSGDALRTWSVVTAVLVVSCPCAIGLAFPLADEMATVALRRRGVFVRESDLVVEARARAQAGVRQNRHADARDAGSAKSRSAPRPRSQRARSASLLALVRDNPQHVSQCLLENLFADGALEPCAGEIQETVGFGVEIGPWSLGRPGWRTIASEDPHAPVDRGGEGNDTEFARDGEALARFRFVDTARPDALRGTRRAGRPRIFDLHPQWRSPGPRCPRSARELWLPPDRGLGELTQQAKADWLDASGANDALMLGDGANDSLAFDRALCRGTPVIHRGLLERKADFYYLGPGHRRTQGTVRNRCDPAPDPGRHSGFFNRLQPPGGRSRRGRAHESAGSRGADAREFAAGHSRL